MEHAMARLAQGASSVMNTKAAGLEYAKRVTTLDDKMQGNLLAQEAWAQARMSQNPWKGFADRIIGLNMEARAAFISAVDGLLKDAKKANTLDGTVEAKTAARRVASATVEVSKLRTFAKAFNAGASEAGLLEYVRLQTKLKPEQPLPLSDVAWMWMSEYARTFSDSKAGRKPDSFLVKLNKFLERNKPDGTVEADMKAYDKVVEFYNSLV